MIGASPNVRPQLRQSLLDIVLWLCLALAVGLVTATLFGDYRYIFHSDGALKSILAAQGAAEGRFLARLWVYANGDLLFVGPLLVSSLLRPLFGIGYLGNAAAGWICYLYLLAAVFATCRYLEPSSKRAAIAAAALAAGGLGVSNFEFVVGQAAYPVYAALALALFSMASVFPASRKGTGLLWISIAFAGSALFCSANPVRGVATMLAPVLAGWLVGCLLMPIPFRERPKLLASPTIAAILAGGIAGSAVYYAWLLPSVSNYDAAAKIRLATPAQAIDHLVSIVPAWYEYFRVGGPWATLDIPMRLLQSSVWLLATFLILSPLYVVLRARRESPTLFIFSWIVLAGYGSSFAALTLSAVLFTGPVEIRYATFPIYGAICITAILASRIRGAGRSSALLLAMCLLGVASAPTGRKLQAAPHIATFGVSYDDRMSLITSLQQHGVGTALAGYWNSYVLTVLSNGDVFAYPIGVDRSHVFSFAHHAPRLVLHGSNGNRQAVVLSKADTADPLVWSAVRYQFGDPVASFESGPFTVWVYDSDLAEMVFGVGYAISAPIPPSELRVDLSLGEIPPCGGSVGDCRTEVTIRNSGARSLATSGSLPLRLGIQGLASNGQIVAWDLGRVDFPRPLNQGESAKAIVDLPDQTPPGVVGYHLCLLQESVAWMCERTNYDPAMESTP